MKYFVLLILSSLAFSEIVRMQDGTCYERRGKMNYISPCNPQESEKPKPVIALEPSSDSRGSSAPAVSSERSVAPVEPPKSDNCTFRRGRYEIEYKKPKSAQGRGVSCTDAERYIDSVNLSYDKKLLINKKPIGTLVVNRAIDTCYVKLYYGDFMTVGLMSGDRLMCDDLISGFVPANSRRR